MRAALNWLRVVGDFFDRLCLGLRSRSSLAAENLFLRKQLAFYQERKVKPQRDADPSGSHWCCSAVLLSRWFNWRDGAFSRSKSQRIHGKGAINRSRLEFEREPGAALVLKATQKLGQAVPEEISIVQRPFESVVAIVIPAVIAAAGQEFQFRHNNRDNADIFWVAIAGSLS